MGSAKLLVFIVLVTTSLVQGQNNQPFTFTAYGGLFFPSNIHHQDRFESSSDIIWGVGGNYPVMPLLFVSGDIGFFRAEAFHNSNLDSSSVLEEKFIHFGLLKKEYLGSGLFLRLMGGVSTTSVKQESHGANSAGKIVEADKNIGYFGGIGIEELVEGAHFSFLADVVYDYRRVQQRDLSGDFGGLRLVLGVNMIMF